MPEVHSRDSGRRLADRRPDDGPEAKESMSPPSMLIVSFDFNDPPGTEEAVQ
jgi:hypothetical protein